jgi:hypothetical protein
MFDNSDNNNDIEVGHTRSGISFREVPLVNLFEKNHEPPGSSIGRRVLQWRRRRVTKRGTFRAC